MANFKLFYSSKRSNKFLHISCPHFLTTLFLFPNFCFSSSFVGLLVVFLYVELFLRKTLRSVKIFNNK